VDVLDADGPVDVDAPGPRHRPPSSGYPHRSLAATPVRYASVDSAI
jgi:hypothetical protein